MPKFVLIKVSVDSNEKNPFLLGREVTKVINDQAQTECAHLVGVIEEPVDIDISFNELSEYEAAEEQIDYFTHSYHCHRWLGEIHKLQVCQSAAGFYIGATCRATGEPLSRDSVEYYPTKSLAEQAFHLQSWTQRPNP